MDTVAISDGPSGRRGRVCRDGANLVVGLRMRDAGDEKKIDPGVTRSATTRHANPRSSAAKCSSVRHEGNRPRRAFCQKSRSFCYPPFPVLRRIRAERADPFGPIQIPHHINHRWQVQPRLSQRYPFAGTSQVPFSATRPVNPENTVPPCRVVSSTSHRVG